MGGIVRAVEEGYPQREIARSAYRFQRQVDSGERAVVGVNRHTSPTEGANIPTLKIDQRPSASRERGGAPRAGAGVRRACDGDGNIMEAVLEAARRDATLGEICQVFREVFGEYRDPAHV